MYKFPSINQFHTVVKHHAANATGRTYRGKIKLHGTNAGIHITPLGDVYAQSRNHVITSDKDNAGFATWVEENKEYFASLSLLDNVVVYGEWCGKGIMKNVAISELERKVFCVFAIMWDLDEETATMVTEPAQIEAFFRAKHADIYVLPWHTNPVEINFLDPEHMQKELDCINEWVAEIDEVDPWVKDIFGVEGHGEGLVFTPQGNHGFVERWDYSKHAFKVKGEKHNVVKQRMPAMVDAQVASSMAEFADMFATVPRFEQMVADNNLEFEMKNMGTFLKAFSKDVLKESVDELEVSGLKWNQACKAAVPRARDWFMAKAKEL